MKPMLCLLAGVFLAGGAATTSQARPVEASGTHVACQLPPQIRRLGRQATYLAAGRIITTTSADCQVRGGRSKPLPPAQAGAPAVAADGTMAVMVGGDRKSAACPVSGDIVGLRAGSTLAVRAGPGTSHARTDRLANGRRVFVCDGSADEAWLGVVYPTSDGLDCGVGKPLKNARPYAGPCAVGWVNAGWVRTQ